MTQEPQQPPVDPRQGPEESPDPVGPGQAPAQQQPGQEPPAQPPWGQYAQQPQQPPAQPWGQPHQPGQGQPQQPQQPQWGQYAQQPQQPPQPQWGQYAKQPGPNPYGYNQYIAPPKPGVIPLRPLRLGEVLDGAFQAARRNGKAMFGSALIFQVITAVITLAITLTAVGRFDTNIFNGSFSEAPVSEAELNGMAGSLLQLFIGLGVVSIVSALLQMVLQGALVVPVLRATLNRKTGFGQMWRLVKPRIGTLLLLALLYAAATFLAVALYGGVLIGLLFATNSMGSSSGGLAALGFGFLLGLPFLAAGIWAAVKVMLAPASIVVEDIGVFAGIRRSWQLTRQNWWRAFGIAALAAIIAGVIGSIITTPVGLLLGLLLPVMSPNTDQLMTASALATIISTFIGALVGAVTVAFQTGVMALIYVDLRMRRDGFDVTLLKESESGKDDGGIPGRGAPVPSAVGQYPPNQQPPNQQPPAQHPPNQYPPDQYPGQ